MQFSTVGPIEDKYLSTAVATVNLQCGVGYLILRFITYGVAAACSTSWYLDERRTAIESW